MSSSSPLLEIPAELSGWIAGHVAKEDLLSFALTCKTLHNHSQDSLEVQKRSHVLHRVKHDRIPSSIPSLLRLAITDPEAAWHIRTLDLWCAHTMPKEWKTWPYRDNNPTRNSKGEVDPDWPDPFEDFIQEIALFFSSDERREIRWLMHKHLHFSPEVAKQWVAGFAEGWDIPMKGLLLALLPRLQSVNFVGYRGWGHTRPLELFCERILTIHHLPTKPWPPGFASLRRVDVDTRTVLRNYTGPHCKPHEVEPLFLLPNLKTLNLTRISEEDECSFLEMFREELDEELGDQAESYLQPRGSNITELGLDDCDIGLTYLSRFLRAPARLSKFSIEPRPRTSLASDDLVRYHAHTLMELHAPGIEEKYLKKLKSLTVFDSLYIDTLVVHVGRQGSKDTLKHNSQPRSVQLLDPSVILPPTLKKLGLQLGREWKHGPQPLGQLLSMLADLGDNPRFIGARGDMHVGSDAIADDGGG